MIHKAELAKAIAQAEQANKRNTEIVARIMRSINDAEDFVAQLSEQGQKEAKRVMEYLKENEDLRLRNAALNKELMDQTSRANRLEAELKEQVMKNQTLMEFKQEIYPNDSRIVVNSNTPKKRVTEKTQESKERVIPMSSVLSFGSTRMTQDSVQTIVDLLYFALKDRSSEEDKAIKKMMADFRKAMRPQMDVKDSTQNFYM